MWFNHSAIPAIASYARVPALALETAAARLNPTQSQASSAVLAAEFARCQLAQPFFARWLSDALQVPMDDAPRSLGITLALTIWSAFEQSAGERLAQVAFEDCESAEQLLGLDEQLRRDNPKVLLESDDIIAMQQPSITAFVRARMDETISAHASDIDIDEMDVVYRLLLTEVLVLSYAVRPPEDTDSPASRIPS